MTNSLLDKVTIPQDLRSHIKKEELEKFCQELREETINIVSKTGGHLGAGLGVIELTTALHYVFDTPKDKLIFDVGHQTYPHKILTGRKDKMLSLRKENGLSGFTKREESEYDHFGAGHSSTSISAGVGMAIARDLNQEDFFVIPVIGDGAISAGMAYEALNNAHNVKGKFLVILNDNDMSIARPTGAMSTYLAKLITSKGFSAFRNSAKNIVRSLPEFMQNPLIAAERRTKGIVNEVMLGNNFFENLGFKYFGPIDGHNINDLVTLLENYRNNPSSHPVILHVITKKGHGYKPAEESADKYHGVVKFDVDSGKQEKKSGPASYTSIFAKELCNQAQNDKNIVAITAAMPSGTGLDIFAKEFPDRCFDVGIAEQHAVTFAAGLATSNIKPFVAIYSTFLQRAYDQIVHDVAIQNLPVRFAIDRAGYVGADGATHAGSFDITYLASLPNFIVAAPADEQELCNFVKTAALYNKGPFAFRYPRGNVTGLTLKPAKKLTIGKGRIIQKGEEIAILSLGTRLEAAKKASTLLKEVTGKSITICDMRFAKPIDRDLLKDVCNTHKSIITIEEGSIGGFASQINATMQEEFLNNQTKNLFFPDIFIEQMPSEIMYKKAGLEAEEIYNCLKNLLK